MGAVRISYNAGIIMLSISEEYYRYCDTAASNLALVLTRDLSYFALIYYSFSRCRLLCFPPVEHVQGPHQETVLEAEEAVRSLNAAAEVHSDDEASTSWYKFVSKREGMTWNEYIRSKKVFALCLVYGLSFAVLLICGKRYSGIIILGIEEGRLSALCHRLMHGTESLQFQSSHWNYSLISDIHAEQQPITTLLIAYDMSSLL